MTVDLGEHCDVIVTLAVLSRVPEERAFVQRLHDLLRRGARLLSAAQNRPVLRREWLLEAPGFAWTTVASPTRCA